MCLSLNQRSTARAGVEGAVGAEGQAPDGLIRVPLEPVRDKDLLGPDHHVAAYPQPRQPPADGALVGIGRRAAVPPYRCGFEASRRTKAIEAGCTGSLKAAVTVTVTDTPAPPAGGEKLLTRGG
jgi:hypothetical protein